MARIVGGIGCSHAPSIAHSYDRGLQNEQHLHEQLIFILGGRAAEYVMYATVSSGAANDLQQANLLAREAVEKWGLSPRVGQLISEHGLSERAGDRLRRAA